MLTRQRCMIVALGTTGAALGALRLLAGCWSTTAPGPDAAVVRLCLAALAIATGWAWLSATSAVVEAWRGRPSGRRTLLRRFVLACCGVVLVAPTPVAMAEDHDPTPVSIDGLPLPDRAVGPGHPSAAAAPRPVLHDVRDALDARDFRVVRPGDCLWHLAESSLPPGATQAQVATRWRAIYRLNQDAIGPDPDLIRPGQRLVMPPRSHH